MATIEKRGRGYRIRASAGYTVDGKQVRPSITWTPEPGMTPRQVEKELARQAALFDDEIQNNAFVDSRIKLEAFTVKYMADFGELHLKAKTCASYKDNLLKINAALGHIKLCDLKPAHINAFYKNLQEEGVRETGTMVAKASFDTVLQEKNITAYKLAQLAGVSYKTTRAAALHQNIARAGAEKMAEALGVKVAVIFSPVKNNAPLAPATVLSYHRTLSAVLAKAVKWGYLQSNPADRAEKPKLGRQESAYLDEADARQLLQQLQAEPIKWRTLITFDLLSGLRRGELLGLRWCDIDLDSQVIFVRQTSNYLPGQGVYTSTPKTASSRRPLKLARVAILLLEEYKRWQDAQREKLGDAWEDEDGRVFTTDSGAPIFPDSVTAWFTAFVRRSGLPKVTIHSLRHTYASLMIADGTPLVVVSRQLGHAQTSTTANIYSHVIAAAEAKAQEAVEDRFKDLVAVPESAKKAAGK